LAGLGALSAGDQEQGEHGSHAPGLPQIADRAYASDLRMITGLQKIDASQVDLRGTSIWPVLY
jgi:hypothetical protein